MGDALFSRPPPDLPFDQMFLTKLTNYYKNESFLHPKRSIFKDLRYLIHMISENHANPKLFLYDVGIIIFSKEIIGMQKRKLANLFLYTGQGFLNSIFNHHWEKISADSPEIPFDVKLIPKWKTWRFYKIPSKDIISVYLEGNQRIYVKEINEIVETRSVSASPLIKLMCQCEKLRNIKANI